MPTNIKNVSFSDPLDPIASAIQQEQIARQQQLADTLRQQSFQENEVAPGSSVSWTQGVARLAEALAANRLTRRNMAAQYDLGTQAQNAQRAIHGLPPLDSSSNPYSMSEQGRNLGQRIGDTLRGGPPVGADAKAKALAARLSGANADPQPVGNASRMPGGTGSLGSNGQSVTAIPASSFGTRGSPQGDLVQRGPVAQNASEAAGQLGVNLPKQLMPNAPQTVDIPPSNAAPDMGAQTPQGAPQAPKPTPQGNGQGEPMDPTMPWMTAQQGYMFQLTNPQGAQKAQEAFNTPTDGLKAITQAGIDPNSPQGRAFLYAYAQKTTQTPIGDDKRGYLYDPYTGATVGYHPMLETGQQPTADANGNVNGVRTLPGFAQSTGEIKAAQAVGTAHGELTTVVDPATGRSYQIPKSSLLGGDMPRSASPPGFAPSPTRGAGGAGPITSMVSGGAPNGSTAGPNGAPSALSPGEVSAGKTYGDASGKAFAAIQDAARDAPQRISALREMSGLVQNGFQTGPMQARLQDLATKYGLPFGTTDNGFIFNKDAARYTAQLAGELGLNGSDARLGLVAHATPGMQITPGALKQVIPTYIGLEMAKSARAAASTDWVNKHGAATNAGFEKKWRELYDPRVFSALAQGKASFQRQLSSLDAPTQARIRRQYNELAAMGVDFNGMVQ